MSEAVDHLQDFFCSPDLVDVLEEVLFNSDLRMGFWDDVLARFNIKTLQALLEYIINFPEEERFTTAIMTEISIGLDPFNHTTERGQFLPNEVRKLHQVLTRKQGQMSVDEDFAKGGKRRRGSEKHPVAPPFIAK